jgi:hypothetical protein
MLPKMKPHAAIDQNSCKSSPDDGILTVGLRDRFAALLRHERRNDEVLYIIVPGSILSLQGATVEARLQGKNVTPPWRHAVSSYLQGEDSRLYVSAQIP